MEIKNSLYYNSHVDYLKYIVAFLCSDWPIFGPPNGLLCPFVKTTIGFDSFLFSLTKCTDRVWSILGHLLIKRESGAFILSFLYYLYFKTTKSWKKAIMRNLANKVQKNDNVKNHFLWNNGSWWWYWWMQRSLGEKD